MHYSSTLGESPKSISWRSPSTFVCRPPQARRRSCVGKKRHYFCVFSPIFPTTSEENVLLKKIAFGVMPNLTTRSSLKNYEARKRRRRTSLSTKAKYSKPTPGNQKRQIVSLAKAVERNTKVLRSQRVYTDYQWGQAESRGMYAEMVSGTWYGWQLTDVAQWQPVLRQDENTVASSRTFAARVQLNCRANLGTVSNICYLNVFLVKCRPDMVEALNVTDLVGGMTQLSAQHDFIEQSFNETANVRLNSGRFKVLACKYMTFMPNTGASPLPADAAAGNPYSTWKKWQWNVPLKFTIRNPSNHPWKNIAFADMPYYERLYVVAYSGSIPSDGHPKLFCDALVTCVNYN